MGKRKAFRLFDTASTPLCRPVPVWIPFSNGMTGEVSPAAPDGRIGHGGHHGLCGRFFCVHSVHRVHFVHKAVEPPTCHSVLDTESRGGEGGKFPVPSGFLVGARNDGETQGMTEMENRHSCGSRNPVGMGKSKCAAETDIAAVFHSVAVCLGNCFISGGYASCRFYGYSAGF